MLKKIRIPRNWNRRLLAILLLALVLRLIGIDFGLPYPFFYADEVRELGEATHMLRDKTPVPNAYHIPTGYSYQTVGAILIGSCIYSAGKYIEYYGRRLFSPSSAEGFWDRNEVPIPGRYQSGWRWYGLWTRSGRLLTVFYGLASIVMLFLLTRLFTEQTPALLAALFLALDPTHLRTSHYLRHDIPFLFWFLFATYFLVRCHQEGTLKAYLWAALGIGLAAGHKYWSFVLIPSLVLLFARGVFREEWKWHDRRIFLSGLVTLGGLFALCPFLFLHFREAMASLSSGTETISAGTLLAYSDSTLLEFAVYMPYLTGILLLAVIPGIFYVIRKQDPWLLSTLLLGPLLLLAYLGTGHVAGIRYILPVLALICLLAGIGTWVMMQRIREQALGASLIVAMVAWPLILNFAILSLMTGKETRIEALEWVQKNVPPDTKIARTFYGPPIEFELEGPPPWEVRDFTIGEAIDVSLQDLKDDGVRYLIIASRDYLRYYREVESDEPWFDTVQKGQAWYDDLYRKHPVVAEFHRDAPVSFLPGLATKLQPRDGRGAVRYTPHFYSQMFYGQPAIEIYDLTRKKP